MGECAEQLIEDCEYGGFDDDFDNEPRPVQWYYLRDKGKSLSVLRGILYSKRKANAFNYYTPPKIDNGGKPLVMVGHVDDVNSPDQNFIGMRMGIRLQEEIFEGALMNLLAELFGDIN